MYKVELIPVSVRIQNFLQDQIKEKSLNRNKLVNDTLAAIISADQRNVLYAKYHIEPSLLQSRITGHGSIAAIIKLRKDLLDYITMQSWGKSQSVNIALIIGLAEIATGFRIASNYQSGRRQHYRPTAANQELNTTVMSNELTPPWSFDKCCINGEWAGAQICGFCARYNVRGRFCAHDLKFKTAQDFCSRFIERREGTYYICARCMNFDKQCKFGTEPNRQSHNCQAYYPAP
jgi:hypothetical protein